MHSPQFFGDDDATVSPRIGDRVKIYWLLEDNYFPSQVSDGVDENTLRVDYDDGNTENLAMSKETLQYASSAALQELFAQVSGIKNDKPAVLNEIISHFGCKSFFRLNV